MGHRDRSVKWGRVLAFLLAFSFIHTAHLAQQPLNDKDVLPCSNADKLKARSARICDEVLPASLRVYYATPEGNSCYCECEGLKDLTMAAFDSLRRQRSARYAKSLMEFNEKYKGIDVHSAAPSGGASDDCAACDVEEELPNNIILCGELPCSEDEPLKERLMDVSASGLTYGDVAEFRFVLCTAPTDCEKQFASITGVDYDDDPDIEFPVIKVPSSFMRHVAVRDELLMFFLLHEMGHGVGDCGGDGTNCEPDADAWAIEIGFNAVYGADYATACSSAVAQLETYYTACYDPIVRDLPHATDAGGSVNNYPKLSCRTGLMLAMASADLETHEIDAYVDSYMTLNDCWDGAATVTPPSASWKTDCGACDPKSKGGDLIKTAVNDCTAYDMRLVRFVVFPEFQAGVELYGSTKKIVERHNEIYCARYPEKCKRIKFVLPDTVGTPGPIPPMDPTDLDRLLRSTEKQVERMSRKMEATERRSLRLLQRSTSR